MVRIAVGFLGVLLFGVGCRPTEGAGDREPRPMTVAVSIAPQKWLVEQIGGEAVEVFSVVPPAASPATYQPSDAEVSRIMRSAAFFRIGVPFEKGEWMDALGHAPRLRIIDQSEGIERRSMARHRAMDGSDTHSGGAEDSKRKHGSHSGKDPHIWLSPSLLKRQAETVTSGLASLDPEREEGYRARLEALQDRLDELDRELAAQLGPFEGRAFFVFHPAWGYFAEAYGLEQVAIELEAKEPTDHELTRLQKRAEAKGVGTLFVQKQFSSRAAEAVARAIGGRVVTLDPLESDVPKQLRHLADELVKAFTSEAQVKHK